MYSILVVDDEPLVTKGIRIILERSNLPLDSIREAENGEEALSMMKEKIPDIIITDIRMPKMDGLELCRKIYRKCPNTSILIISGYDDFKYAQEAMQYGVRQYLLKPVQKSELVKVISAILQEKGKKEKLPYIAHGELESVVTRLETGLWSNAAADLQNGLQMLKDHLEDIPLDYGVKIVDDITEMLLSRLSLKIGYALKVQIPPFAGQERKDFYAWFNEVLKKLQLELKERRDKADYNLFEMAKQYIKENYANDITLEELARKTGFSTNYFSQLFKLKTGKSFVQFRSEIRITKAMELLLRPDKTITEVAMDVGYNDLTYFIRAFKEYTGLTPNEYKRKRG